MATRIAYLRGINGLPIEVQREMARDAGCKITYEHNDVQGKDSRELFKARLTKADIAWVASLAVFVKRRKELGRIRMGADLSGYVTEVIRVSERLEVATRNISSDDPEFAGLLKSTLQSISIATRDPKKVAEIMKKARKARAKPGMISRWHAAPMREKFERQLALWQSMRFKTDQEAIAALHPDLQSMSPSAARRFFKAGRRPSRKGMGGKASNKR